MQRSGQAALRGERATAHECMLHCIPSLGDAAGFATTSLNFGPYGNFILPGGLVSTFTPGVPSATPASGGAGGM